MINLKFMAWHKLKQQMYEVDSIYFGTDSDPTVLVKLRGRIKLHRNGEEVELLQYLDFKDCKGQQICEGHIVRIENATAVVVFWGRPPAFGLEFSHNEDEWCEDWNLTDDHDRMEVIGNIYEHQYLLTQRNGD
jgi:YopX protein